MEIEAETGERLFSSFKYLVENKTGEKHPLNCYRKPSSENTRNDCSCSEFLTFGRSDDKADLFNASFS